jgi:hypothetical protein
MEDEDVRIFERISGMVFLNGIGDSERSLINRVYSSFLDFSELGGIKNFVGYLRELAKLKRHFLDSSFGLDYGFFREFIPSYSVN